MIHPLLRLFVSRPQLLAEHAEAYAGLVGEAVGRNAAAWKRRAMLEASTLGLAAVAVVLGGVALMLWAVVPLQQLHAPWALFVVPGAPALGALGCALAARHASAAGFGDLREQVAADLQMLREVGSA